MGSWSLGLLTALKDSRNWIISSNEIVVISDKFPKAKFHFLVLPRKNIPTIFDVSKFNFILYLAKCLKSAIEKYRNSSQEVTWNCWTKCIWWLWMWLRWKDNGWMTFELAIMLNQVCSTCIYMSFQMISIHRLWKPKSIGTHSPPNISYHMKVNTNCIAVIWLFDW